MMYKKIIKLILLALLILVNAFNTYAEEHFNKMIVETFKHMIGRDEIHLAGVDQSGDGLADLFIEVPYANQDPVLRRVAGFLREDATVSYDDTKKTFSRLLGS